MANHQIFSDQELSTQTKIWSDKFTIEFKKSKECPVIPYYKHWLTICLYLSTPYIHRCLAFSFTFYSTSTKGMTTFSSPNRESHSCEPVHSSLTPIIASQGGHTTTSGVNTTLTTSIQHPSQGNSSQFIQEDVLCACICMVTTKRGIVVTRKNKNVASSLPNLAITHQSALTDGKQGTVIHGEGWVDICQPKLNSKQAARPAYQ